jgi:glycine C-acetyltransferase
VLDLLEASTERRDRLMAHTAWFRRAMADAGLAIRPGEHPIVPVMVGDAVLAQRLAARLLALGVYVVAFFHPVVPHGQARIRVQVSADHTREQLQQAVDAFAQAAGELGLLRR